MTNDTIVLTEGKGERIRYNFRQMLDYCIIVDKEIEELSIEEKQQFIIKGENE